MAPPRKRKPARGGAGSRSNGYPGGKSSNQNNTSGEFQQGLAVVDTTTVLPIDQNWFLQNPNRYMRLRKALWLEGGRPNTSPLWVAVVRSKHSHNWNTVVVPFFKGMARWHDPHSDLEAFGIIFGLNVEAANFAARFSAVPFGSRQALFFDGNGDIAP